MTDWKNKIKRKGLGIAPQEASSNLEVPELGKDARFTGRTKQLGLRVKPEFARQLKMLAAEEDCLLVEVLEKALESYKREKQELENYVKVIEPKPKKVFSHPDKNFNCDNCGTSFQNEIAYSYAPSLGKTTRTYCRGCIENK